MTDTTDGNTELLENIIEFVSYTPPYIICLITRLIFLLCVYYWSFVQKTVVYNWPPMLLTMAFCFLITISVRHYRMVRVCQNRQTRTQMQYIIFQHSTTLVLLTAAEYVALYTKVDPNIDITNSESLLNWLGIVTIILYFIQIISGFFIYLYPRWFTVHNNTVQSVHTSMGIVSFVFVIGIAVFGFSQEFLNALDNNFSNFASEKPLDVVMGLLRISYGIIAAAMIYKHDNNNSVPENYDPLPTN